MNRKAFFDAVRTNPFAGSLTQFHVDGMTAILGAWDRHGDGDTRKLAYILATAKWETAHTFAPIAEIGRGRGRKYGKPDPVTGKTYFGRGFVQLTWKTNYARAGRALNIDLVNRPDLAMQPGPAAEIIVRGMMDAWFTRYRLADFINDQTQDFHHARRIVNGMDKAGEIAAIAGEFNKAIKTAEAAPGLADGQTPPRPARAGARTGVRPLLALIFNAILTHLTKWRQS